MTGLGFRSVPCHPLLAMTPDERRKEAARLDYETLVADAADRLRYQVDIGQAMLRSLTLVNGGAIVALFTLVGHQAQGLTIDPMLLKRAFAFFIAGLMFALLSSFGGFLSQFWYAFTSTAEAWNKQAEMLGAENPSHDFRTHYRRGSWALIACVAGAALSLASFGAGGWAALSAVIELSSSSSLPR